VPIPRCGIQFNRPTRFVDRPAGASRLPIALIGTRVHCGPQ
jgi:hypothetical protein